MPILATIKLSLRWALAYVRTAFLLSVGVHVVCAHAVGILFLLFQPYVVDEGVPLDNMLVFFYLRFHGSVKYSFQMGYRQILISKGVS